MRQLFVLVSLWLFALNTAVAQTATLRGTVKDGKTGELLESVNVVQPPANGTTTDILGNYELKVAPGEVILIFSYIGMNSYTVKLNLKPGETKILNRSLGGAPTELPSVVIGENKIGTKLQKITQSVDIMKPRILQNNNITNMQQAVVKVPGVNVLDGQMSIRGGSGYAYGSGSRVVLVVDEMPLMTADRGGIVWALIPIENVEQMEITKGAATVQYGSSALNGVLNITTAYARDTPSTRFSLYYEGTATPPVDTFKWWKRDGKLLENPNTVGMTFLHKQKFGDFDFVFSGMMQGSQSHLYQEYDHFLRYNSKVRWQPKKLKRLTLEMSASVLYRKSGTSFYWQDAHHPYLTASGVDLDERYFYAYVDPKFRYLDKKNNQHKLFTRYYTQKNMDGQTNFQIFRVDYQFRHDFGKIGRILLGVNNEHGVINDGTLGRHKMDLGGGFLQGEVNYKWLTVNLGVREEFVRLDSAITPTLPVFRAGLNFEVKQFNYLRASFGQAFRVPSIAERFVTYKLGSIEIRPNYTVKPESGFTAEIGYKRSLKFGNWLGYFDAVAFWTEFKNMLEFTFDFEIDSAGGFHPYFQSRNIAKARIFGWELSAFGEGKMGPVDLTALVGYTYFYGVDLNDEHAPKTVGAFLKNAFTKYSLPKAEEDVAWDSIVGGMLKYRTPHIFKADLDFLFYNKVRFGTSIQYYSYMVQVDKVFRIFIPDVNKVRQETRNQGDVVWDLRAGYDFNKNVGVNFLVKNVLNSNYAIRIAKPNAPRTFTVQLVVNFGAGENDLASRRASKAAGNL